MLIVDEAPKNAIFADLCIFCITALATLSFPLNNASDFWEVQLFAAVHAAVSRIFRVHEYIGVANELC